MAELVCVTGAGGFIAGHTVAQLLSAGYRVRGTCRDPSSPSVQYLHKLPGADDRLELVQADLLEEGSFDLAVAGCSGVIHMASPVILHEVVQADLLLKPAREGTVNVLKSCKRAGTVKRVVMTSSFATIIFGHDHAVDPTPYTDKEWNEVSQPTEGDAANIYRSSKVQAERAAWAFVDAEGDAASFSLVTINPPMVVGQWLPGYTRLNDSCKSVKMMLDGSMKDVADGGMGWIDVEDVARAHISALHPEASGRYLVASESHLWIDIAICLSGLYPEASVPTTKRPGTALKPEYDITRTIHDLKFKPSRPIAESLQRTAQSMMDVGLLSK